MLKRPSFHRFASAWCPIDLLDGEMESKPFQKPATFCHFSAPDRSTCQPPQTRTVSLWTAGAKGGIVPATRPKNSHFGLVGWLLVHHSGTAPESAKRCATSSAQGMGPAGRPVRQVNKSHGRAGPSGARTAHYRAGEPTIALIVPPATPGGPSKPPAKSITLPSDAARRHFGRGPGDRGAVGDF